LALASELGAAPAVAETASARPSFDVLDDVVRLRDTSGVLAVRVPGVDEAIAVACHIERRAQAIARPIVRASVFGVESGWRDAATRLGVDRAAHDPVEVAREVALRAAAERALVVVPLCSASPWDDAVSEAVGEIGADALYVVIATPNVTLRVPAASWFEVCSELDDAALDRWWEAVASAERRAQAGRLSALEQWVDRVARPGALRPRAPELDESEQRWLERLCLAERAWPAAAVDALGDTCSLDALVRAGWVEMRDGLVAPSSPRSPSDSGAAELRHVASALEHTFADDAWALARRAELLAAAGDECEAEQAMHRAFELGADALSRAELWRRWDSAIEKLGDGTRARLAGAELALSLGDVDVALAWAERASAGASSARAALVLGRAALARGDLVSAEAALERARAAAVDDEARFEVAVELGEVRYAAGDLEAAEALGREVAEGAGSPRVRLGGRNLIGKLMLARSEWTAADRHFAADACEAAFAAETVCELRARVNRAVALLSGGSAEEARPMLLEVLERAEERGELRAVGFALSNLSVLAIDRHEYGRALELSERAIGVSRRIGDRLWFAREVTNLVELRLRLGLIDQAEQALRFGRQALGPGAPASRLAELALAAARVHLEKGRTLEAEREVRAAMRTAGRASDGDKLGECHRLAARVALENGLVARAEAELERARELASSPFARAEISVVEALVERSAGRPASEAVASAVAQARESGDEELAREAHVLGAEVALAAGDERGALSHVVAAVALRDEVARSIGPKLQEAYLARRDLLSLSRLERLTSSAPPDEAPELEPVSQRRSARRGYVGRHPAVRALLVSAERVARTDATVLIHGESGTGKELIAEAIHAGSRRSSGPLVKVNCAALVESLLMSELFGHEKGAFTGAGARKRGRFERAHGGTLFLDEIGDISPRTQVALLRVLEESTIERVGGTAPIPVDVRIVCATHRDLPKLIEQGQFRQDLFYRLGGMTLEVPALRERLADLPLLCDAILARIAEERGEQVKSVTDDGIELLARHRWPGNVRELENALRAASLFAAGDRISASDLGEHVETLRKLPAEAAQGPRLDSTLPSLPPPPNAPSFNAEEPEVLVGAAYREIRDMGLSLSDVKRRIERDCIERALQETNGNITRAASLLGMKRPRLSQLVKQYALLSNPEEEDPS
jgi:DNA-binding NtrC family response regulator/tetratricopeptide (TPR) repeat protein